MIKVIRLSYQPEKCEPGVVFFNTSNNTVHLNTADSGSTPTFLELTNKVPVGTIIMHGSKPGRVLEGWLDCHGQEVDKLEYAALFAVVGHKYSNNYSPGKFRLPDFSNRFPVANSAEGGEQGGSNSVNISINDIPAHSHKYYGLDYGYVRSKPYLSDWGRVNSNFNWFIRFYNQPVTGMTWQAAQQHVVSKSGGGLVVFDITKSEHYKIRMKSSQKIRIADPSTRSNRSTVQSKTFTGSTGRQRTFDPTPPFVRVRFLIKT